MVNEDNVIKTDDFLTTETTIDPTVSPTELVSFLRSRKTTGQLTFHLTQGGIQKIGVTEKTKAKVAESSKMRDVLGMEK